MAAERDSFGYYFSAHPVEAHRHVLDAHKVKTYAELGDLVIREGERVSATMAGMVEGARWRVSQRGKRYMMADFSDRSGQFGAMAFDDDATTALEAASKSGGCGLLTVELDRRAGDESPRVTVKRYQPLEKLAERTRLQLRIAVSDPAMLPALASELDHARGGKGIVRLVVQLEQGGEAVVVAGRDFMLDAELASRIARLVGEDQVKLTAIEPARLALVG